VKGYELEDEARRPPGPSPIGGKTDLETATAWLLSRDTIRAEAKRGGSEMSEAAALAQLPAALPRRIARKTIAAAREQGVLASDDHVEAVAQLLKYNPGIWFLLLVGVLPGFVAVFGFQRQCSLIVTTRHVIFSRWANLFGIGKSAAQTLNLNRPVQLALSQEPKKSHAFGNRVELPPQVAEFLGRNRAYAAFGNAADEAFRIARTPSDAVEPSQPDVQDAKGTD
jgi:hypothetical protein